MRPGRRSGFGSNGPTNRRRISEAASRLKIRPGPQAHDAHARGARPRSGRAAARSRPCGASRRSVGIPSVGQLSSTARSFGPGRVGADRGGVDERRNAGPRRRLEDAPAALDVGRLQRRPSREGWISQARWTTPSAPRKQRLEVVARDVGRAQLVFGLSAGAPPRDADDRVDRASPASASARSCPRCRSPRDHDSHGPRAFPAAPPAGNPQPRPAAEALDRLGASSRRSRRSGSARAARRPGARTSGRARVHLDICR